MSDRATPSRPKATPGSRLIRAQKKKNSKRRLIDSLQAGEVDTLRLKVAHTLNYFPAARDSDITLSIKLVKTFYPEFIQKGETFRLGDLYKIPKFYDMQRHRAALQNSFGLFRASPEVEALRKRRQHKEADLKAQQLPDFSPTFVFADESGKTEKHLIIGSLWLYSVDVHLKVIEQLKEWRETLKFTKELHFKEIKNTEDLQFAVQFFDRLLTATSMYAFKALVVKKDTIPSNRRVDALYQAFGEMLIDGVKSEISTNRLLPPIAMHLTKDADPPTDLLKLRELNRGLLQAFTVEFPAKQVTFDIHGVSAAASEASDLVQASDLFTGSINRWLHYKIVNPTNNVKDQFAQYVGSKFGWHFDGHNKLVCTGDVCQISYLNEP